MVFRVSGKRICTEKPAVHVDKMHSHDYYEIYCILSGDADYCVEGSRYHLRAGDIMLMRKGEVHVVQLKSDDTYERICVYFDIHEILEQVEAPQLLKMFNDRPLGKYNHYRAELFPGNHWAEYLDKICAIEDSGMRLCYLLPLLYELAEGMQTVMNAPPGAQKDRAAPIIKYINENLNEELSLDLLAERFYISKAHLNRLFKQATGTTAWEYITVKRLFLAKELISAGTHPTDAYGKCGFNEYTTFFRSYKHHFGLSPKEHMEGVAEQ